ncbi:thioredoxin-like 2 [Hibiscus syriacus]|uniref:Thioredoxin-like 2 n=1 Tax=Hibiscus syriacus TaxID=106335 RepID=A0A6A2XXD4_HIBSY|nr:thioredoxin-like 2 [Hibiscus syriacus]
MSSHEPKWWLGEPLWDWILIIRGHQVGPDDPQITEAVARIDSLIGRLIDGLEKRGVFEDVTIIMVGDHGMYYTPMLAIRPPPSHAPSDFFAKMNEGLEPGKVENGKYLKVYLKEELPSRLHYAASGRIPPIIGLIEESFKGEQKRTKRQECGGAHGYDNAFFSHAYYFYWSWSSIRKGEEGAVF